MANEWCDIRDPIPETRKFVAFFDSTNRMVCVSSRRAEPKFRRNLFSELLVRLRVVKPKATHWYALPDLPEAE